MKRYLLINILFLLLAQAYSQSYKIVYEYDYAGNRIARTVIQMNSKSKMLNNEATPVQELDNCKITIFPNPTKGVLTIAITGGLDDCYYHLLLYTSSGQKLLEEDHLGNLNSPMNLSDYPNGIYILVLRSKQRELQYKIIKQ